jgi:hypothetical protein
MDDDAIRTFRSRASTGSAAFLAGFIDSDLGLHRRPIRRLRSRPRCAGSSGGRVRVMVKNRLLEITMVRRHGMAHPAVHLVDLDAVLTMEFVLSS